MEHLSISGVGKNETEQEGVPGAAIEEGDGEGLLPWFTGLLAASALMLVAFAARREW